MTGLRDITGPVPRSDAARSLHSFRPLPLWKKVARFMFGLGWLRDDD